MHDFCEGALAFAIDHEDEATLINLRYALADALELCGEISTNRAGAAVISQIIKSANVQVMLLLKAPKTEIALLQEERVSSAA